VLAGGKEIDDNSPSNPIE
jgi:hypothetical protein